MTLPFVFHQYSILVLGTSRQPQQLMMRLSSRSFPLSSLCRGRAGALHTRHPVIFHCPFLGSVHPSMLHFFSLGPCSVRAAVHDGGKLGDRPRSFVIHDSFSFVSLLPAVVVDVSFALLLDRECSGNTPLNFARG